MGNGNGTIKSDPVIAGQIATKMRTASSSLSSATGYSISYAHQTSLTINHEAQTVNDEVKQLAILFNDSFLKTIENLQSVEEEFTKTDKAIGTGLAYAIE